MQARLRLAAYAVRRETAVNAVPVVHVDENGRFRVEPPTPTRAPSGERFDGKPRLWGPLFVGCYYCGKRADMQTAVEAPRCGTCNDRFRRKDG